MDSEHRRHVRLPGPFQGFRVGLIDAPVTIYDLSEGGCFVNCLTAAPEIGHHLVVKIELPEEGWICLKCELMYAKPDFGFAVSFVDVSADVARRLKHGILGRQGLLTGSDTDSALVMPFCPRCQGTAVRPLGVAGSSVPWFTCQSCDCTWAGGDIPISPETPIDDAEAVTQSADSPQILVADDDAGVLGLVAQALSKYHVQTAHDVAQAVALARDAPVDLLITDYLMPDGTGDELIRRLREHQPSLKALIMTGHQEMLDEQGYDWWTKERHLGKPFTIRDLRNAVTELVGSP